MIRRTGTALVLIVTLLVVLVLGVLSSTAGNRLMLSWAEDALAPALSVEGLDGSVLSRLCAESVRFEVPAVTIVASDVCVAPELWASVDFLQVRLEALEAGRISVQTHPTGDESQSSTLSLPVVVRVDRLFVGELGVNGVVLNQISGSVNLSDADLSLAGTFDYQSWSAEVASTGPWDRFRVQMQALNASAIAIVDLTEALLPWSLDLTSPKFDLEPFADRPIGLSTVTLTGSGDLSGYGFKAESTVQDPDFTAVVSGSGAGDWGGLTVADLEIRDAALSALPEAQIQTLNSRARVRWSEGFEANLEAVTARAQVADYLLEMTLEALDIDAEGIRIASGVVGLDGLADAGARVDGTVTFGQAVDLDLEVHALPLDLLESRADGLAAARATVRGQASNPQVDGQFEITALTWVGERLGSVDGALQGSLDQGSLDFSVDSDAGTLDAGVEYARTPGGLGLTVLSASATYPRLEATATLDEPVQVAFEGGAARLEETCLTLRSSLLEAAPGKLCGALDYPKGGATVSLLPWRIPTIPLPDNQVSLTGVAELHLDLDTFSPLVGQADVRLTELSALHPEMETLALGELSAAFQLVDGEARVALSTPEDRVQELTLRGSIASTLASEIALSPVTGALYLELDGIWVAKSLLPMDVAFELADVRGIMGIDATIEGTLGDPAVNGTLSLRDAGWHVLALDAQFKEFALDASLRDSDQISFSSSGAVGAGTLELKGRLDGMSGEDPQLVTDFTLDRAAVINLPDYHALVSGTLTLGMGSEDLRLTGELRLPEADILIADLPETAITVSQDEVLVDEGVTAPAQQLRTTDLALVLGDDVRLEAFGLTARLAGNLRLQEAPGRLRSVTGVINLRDGKFEAYGQSLDVEKGQLTFTGQVDNPTVDVIASRVITHEERDYRISLLITGTAQSLRTTVRSQPSLSEDDALALLITGRTFSQISSSEQSNVSGAAISMGLLSATGVTKNLAAALKLEEIIVDQDSGGNMEVGAAVRLNRDLYLRYTYGVFSRLGGVLVRYRFSKRFSVQAKTGDAHSIEIRYGVDD